ncbi:MAG: HAD-IB family phosphatase [bacterium]|nr:HAD-IB family phosphatase [bacterium]
MKKNYFIIDFDSTFVKVETLEMLASVALEGNPDKEKILAEMYAITDLGMEGKIPFHESLAKRIKLLRAHKNHFKKTITTLKRFVSRSFRKNKEFILQNKDQIYILSGAFKELIQPVILDYGIDTSHILANEFMYDKDGNIIGVDASNPLTNSQGKSIIVAGLDLTGKIYVIGDGFTDYEIKNSGVADYFVAYIEHVERKNIIKNADYIVRSFDEFIEIIKSK